MRGTNIQLCEKLTGFTPLTYIPVYLLQVLMLSVVARGGYTSRPLLGERSVASFPLRIVERREELVSFLPERAEGLELGVRTGDFSKQLLESGKFRHLTSIDAWAAGSHDIREYTIAVKKLSRYRANNTIIRALFDDALPIVVDESMDFIYLDGTAKSGFSGGKDLTNWWPKLKRGGLFAGHDYGGKYRLIKPRVDSFFNKKKSENQVTGRLYVTKRGDRSDKQHSWYFRKA